MRGKDVVTFSASAHKKTVETMRARGEEVHDAGERVVRETGHLDPDVDIVDRATGKGKIRVSHNALTGKDDGTPTLVNGIALPTLSAFDGTGSMGDNVRLAFEAIPVMDSMLAGIRHRYNTQVASAVWQDVVDPHPVVQMSQFESDNRIAKQLRLLLPDKGGGDEIEDYDLGLAYLMRTQTDIFDFYGLKGYAFIVADQIGRGQVTPSGASKHLGHKLQAQMSTTDICQQLLLSWHLYYVQVGSGGGASRNSITAWWERRLGQGRIIIVPDPNFLAEVQAGLIYVTETAQPNQAGLVEFLLASGQNKRISQSEAQKVWEWLQDARQHFGAQTHLPSYDSIPKPGDVFANYRDPWPIGHPRSSENPSADEKPAAAPATSPIPTKPIDWSKLY